MKTTELAKRLGLSCMTVRRMAADRRIPGARSSKGGHYYFPASDKFVTWLERAEAAKSRSQEAETKQAKQRRKAELLELRHRELAIQEAVRTVKHPLPTGGGELRSVILASAMSVKDDALRRVFADCSGWMQEAYKVMGGLYLVKLRPNLRSALLQSLAPLEAIAKELRG